jgi:hypothetical protein
MDLQHALHTWTIYSDPSANPCDRRRCKEGVFRGIGSRSKSHVDKVKAYEDGVQAFAMKHTSGVRAPLETVSRPNTRRQSGRRCLR